jgi:hypothetical protein
MSSFDFHPVSILYHVDLTEEDTESLRQLATPYVIEKLVGAGALPGTIDFETGAGVNFELSVWALNNSDYLHQQAERVVSTLKLLVEEAKLP